MSLENKNVEIQANEENRNLVEANQKTKIPDTTEA